MGMFRPTALILCTISLMRRCIVMVLSMLFLLLLEFGSSQDSVSKQNDTAQYVQRLMDIEVGFLQMVPSGMSIEAKEISRKGTSGKDLVVQYHIFVKGAAPDILFSWIQWPISAEKPSTALAGISVGKDGILMCAGRAPEQCGDPKKPDDPIEFIATPRKGEPTRLAFIAPKVKIGIVIVPDPIEAYDKGCTLSSVRLTPNFELAFVSGFGYPPNTDMHYRVSSEVNNDYVIKSDASGTIRVSVISYRGKKSNGIATVKITEPKCSPEVSYEWAQ
jgi:hypothetical protein